MAKGIGGFGEPEADWMPRPAINPENWITVAPTATQEPQQDTTSLHDVYYNSEGIACCAGVQGD